MTEGGTYVLELEVTTPTTVTVGALGTVPFSPGYVGYVGSAEGAGGFTRVDRHRAVATGDRDTRHWHIDYLLGDDAVDLVDTHRFPGQAIECGIADTVPSGIVPGFGSSDCGCTTHLFTLDDAVRTRLERLHDVD